MNRFPTDAVSGFAESVRLHGYAIAADVLSPDAVDQLRDAIEAIPPSPAVRRRTGVYGIRNLLEICPAICELAASQPLRRLVTSVLGEKAFAARAVFFDKNRHANWVLGWHQDSVISVASQVETPGFLAWGRKAGVWQVQPPADVLGRMLALRVHLDDCGTDNGALRVVPGSHRDGWLDDCIDDWRRRAGEVCCPARAGDIVSMCPLVLHASSRAVVPTRRRVIHIEYAADELPGELEWNRRVTPALPLGVATDG